MYGSHSASNWLFSTLLPSLTRILDPKGILEEYLSPSLSDIFILPFLLKTILLLNRSSIIFMFSNLTLPETGAIALDCSTEELAAPPMWNVLIVSWVPGSPIDWAAIIPTASPMFTGVPLARSLP